MAQRISRSKQRIKATGTQFAPPPEAEQPERLRAVRHVLYLVFNEGYAASAGPELQRVELAEEAIRLTRMLHRLLATDGETAGLLALMQLTHARRAARVGPDGALIPLADQDRDPVGPRGDRRGRRDRRAGAGHRSDRPVSAPGGDRRRARRSQVAR